MKRHFVTGIAILLPLALTLWIVGFIIDLLTEPFLGVTEHILNTVGINEFSFKILSTHQIITFLSKVFILIFLFGFIIIVGAIAQYFFFRYIIRIGDKILHRIPVVSGVYKTSQELIQTIFTSDNKAFKQVVLVPFPSATSKTIGLITRDDIVGERIPVFIPTTPNPTSGYLIMFRSDEVTPIEMSVETALRYVISCGVLIDSNSSLNGFAPLSKREEEKLA